MIFSKKFVSLFAAIFVAGFFFFISSAYAITPTLNLAATGNGDNVQINVFGDPNSIVTLYYNTPNGFTVGGIGSTNSSGNFSLIESTAELNISPNSAVYVTVNGNQQSATASWPNISSSVNGTNLTVSQTSLVMTVGETNTITVSNNATNVPLYVSNNSNPPIANISFPSNEQVSISALSVGSSVVSVCLSGNSSNCVSLYVTVLQNGSAQSLTFSQNNVSVAIGQTLPITVSGGTGVYTILNNSNSTVIAATLNGATLNLYAENSSGSASVTICSTDMSSCGIVSATVGDTTSAGITFSQSNPVLGVGQSLPITISGGSGAGTYSINSNSNASVVSATLSSNILTLFASANGSATVTVCSNGACGAITATVNYVATGGAMTLSQTSIDLLLGQTLSVTISGGESPYNIVTSGAAGIFQASLNNNIITITGEAGGSSVLSVCSAGGGCIGLSVTVNASSVSNPTTTSVTELGVNPIFNPSNVSISAGQTSTVGISSGVSSNYYLASNSNPGAAQVTLSGSSINITGETTGYAIVVICSSLNSCAPLFITVNSASSITFTPVNPSVSVGQIAYVSMSGSSGYYISSTQNPYFSASVNGSTLILTGIAPGSSSLNICSTAGSCVPIFITITSSTVSAPVVSANTSGQYQFLYPIAYGDTGTDVTELQTRLTQLGVYSGPITGYYGSLTYAAVVRLQAENNLEQIGSVGPATRAILNQ